MENAGNFPRNICMGATGTLELELRTFTERIGHMDVVLEISKIFGTVFIKDIDSTKNKVFHCRFLQ